APAEPTIVSTVAAHGSLRVRWTDAAGIGEYHAEARAADGTRVAQKDTAEHLADLGGPADGVAHTGSGPAGGRARRGAAARTQAPPQAGLPLAPQLYELAEVPEGLVLGFADPTAGAEFEVEVRDSGDAVVQQYTTTSRPGTRIEGLDAG